MKVKRATVYVDGAAVAKGRVQVTVSRAPRWNHEGWSRDADGVYRHPDYGTVSSVGGLWICEFPRHLRLKNDNCAVRRKMGAAMASGKANYERIQRMALGQFTQEIKRAGWRVQRVKRKAA